MGNSLAPRQSMHFDSVHAAKTVISFAVIYLIAVTALNDFAFRDGWSIIWPVNGVNVGLLIMRPRSSWLWILLGIELGTGIGDLDGGPIWIKVSDRFCSTLEVVTSALLLPRFTTLEQWLRTPRIFIRFLAALVAGPAISGLIVAVIYQAALGQEWLPAFNRWTTADVLGIAGTMPLTLAISSPGMRNLFRPETVWRTLGVLALALIATALMFTLSRVDYLLFPVLLLVDSLLGFEGSTIAVVGVLLILIYCTTNGLGKFGNWTGEAVWARDLPLQIYFGFHVLALFPASIMFMERRRMAKELAKTNREIAERALALEVLNVKADAANRAKSSFLANMSHEIRTPLNGVLGVTQLLLETPLSPEQREYAEIARSSGQSLLGLINDILDVSKIEAGRLDLESIEFDMRKVIDDTVDTVALRAAEKGTEFIVDIDPATHPHYRGDPNRLRQILLNLLSNAVKFTSRGEIGISFTAICAQDQIAQLQFTVWDTGIGIPAERLRALFVPFTQADSSTTRRFGGSGLGLSIAKQLAEAMGGSISAQSTVGVGTTFRVTVHLPWVNGPSVKPVPECRAGLKVLVAVRHPRIRACLGRHLTAAGCRPVLAESDQLALDDYRRQLAEDVPPAVVIVDHALSDHDTTWLASRIRQFAAPPPGLILLRHLAHTPAEGDRTLFDRIINKPVKPSLLLRNVAELTQVGTPAVVDEPAQPLVLPAKTALRVLLADDNGVNQLVASRMLKRCGADVHCVANGVEALEALRRADFDVIFMDCQMPEMDGFEATRQLRNPAGGFRNPTIPVIALTANALATDREECLAAGMNDFLSKPIDRERLEEALLRAVQHQAEDESRLTASGRG